jgi:hypothetical protein
VLDRRCSIIYSPNPRSALQKLAFRAGASSITAFLARIHLRFFDPLYLSKGSLKKMFP